MGECIVPFPITHPHDSGPIQWARGNCALRRRAPRTQDTVPARLNSRVEDSNYEFKSLRKQITCKSILGLNVLTCDLMRGIQPSVTGNSSGEQFLKWAVSQGRERGLWIVCVDLRAFFVFSWVNFCTTNLPPCTRQHSRFDHPPPPLIGVTKN